MILASFLGTGNYANTVYSVETEGWCSPSVRYVQVATALFAARKGEAIDEVLIYATDEARVRHGAGIEAEFSTHLPRVPVRLLSVPSGFNELEALQIFEELHDSLSRRQASTRRVVMDLTHGFRAQSAMGLMVLQYLRQLPSPLLVEDIFYGAWAPGSPDRAPLVSLLAIWELHDWSEAFAAFGRTGRTSMLAELLEAKRNLYGRAQQQLPADRRLYPDMGRLTRLLRQWDTSVLENNIPDIIGADGVVEQLLVALQAEWNATTEDVARFARPLRAAMARDLEPMRSSTTWWDVNGLHAQYHYLRWLERHGHYANVATVSREWFVTFFQHILEAMDERMRADGVFGALPLLKHDFDAIHEPARSDVRTVLERLHIDDQGASLSSVASKLVTIRNGMNHAAMPKNSVTDNADRVNNVAHELRLVLDAMEALLPSLGRVVD